MAGAIPALSIRRRSLLAALCLGAASALISAPAFARGPDGIADVAEKVIDAVVNISTLADRRSQDGGGEGRGAIPQLPPGSPFEEFFDDFFKNRRGGKERRALQPHKTNSLGSGFIIDSAGIVVTNNHVIADADEINVILNDGTKIKAEIVGVDKKTDLAVLKFKPPQAADRGEVRRFRQAAARRMGDRDRQSVQPRRHRHRRHRLGAQPRHQHTAPMTATSRPTPPSTAAIPAARCSISTAR